MKPLYDLRPFSYIQDNVVTSITLEDQSLRKVPFLEFGTPFLSETGRGIWILEGFLGTSDHSKIITDFEHDNARLLRTPLIAVRFHLLNGAHTFLEAWIAPSKVDEDYFRIPIEGYNPLEKLTPCKDCTDVVENSLQQQENRPSHLMTPNYLPPKVPGLYDKLRGSKIEITYGPG
jgi:hypothetical protein